MAPLNGAPELHWHSESERRKPLFVEWVYFKFFAAGTQGIIIYGSAWGMPGVLTAQIFRDGLPPARVVRHDYGRRQVERSTTSYDCRVDTSTITTSGTSRHIEGSIADAGTTISWDLVFEPLAPALAGFDEHFGLLRSWVGWNVIAPLAAVRGTVAVNGEELPIESGTGYVDTNFGRWLFAIDTSTHWNWLMAYDDRTSPASAVVGLNLRGRPELGALFLVSGTEAVRFPCGAQSFQHRRFATDPETSAPIPVLTDIAAADQDGRRLALTATNQTAFIYRQAIPPKEMRGPLPTIFEWTLSESFVRVAGSLMSGDGSTRQFEGTGIKEYPVTRLVFQR